MANLDLDVSGIIQELSIILSSKIDHIDIAKSVLVVIRRLRFRVTSEEDTVAMMCKGNVFYVLLISSQVVLKFAILADEVLRCIQPLLKTKSGKQRSIALTQLIDNGGIIFCLRALKYHAKELRICRNGVEILSLCLDHITEIFRLQEKNIDNKSIFYTKHSSNSNAKEIPKKGPTDIVNQLVLHGATSTLPKILLSFANSSKEETVQAIIKILRFLIVNTSPATSISLSYRIATMDDWCCVHALLLVLRTSTSPAAVDAAGLLLCMVANSEEVADVLKPAGGWDDISSTLAGNLNALRS
eukprot:gene8693-17955_t